MRYTSEAFYWIVDLLLSKQIPFHISGGLAANLYGSKREIVDIDIDISEKYFSILLPEIQPYITYGPANYQDDVWNLELITLVYKGQEIDLAGTDKAKIFNKNTETWEHLPTDFRLDNTLDVFGISVPVISKSELIDYKSKIMRDVDIADIEAILGI